MSDWNTVAHAREAVGRCPNCNERCADWLVEHGDGDGGFTCVFKPEVDRQKATPPPFCSKCGSELVLKKVKNQGYDARTGKSKPPLTELRCWKLRRSFTGAGVTMAGITRATADAWTDLLGREDVVLYGEDQALAAVRNWVSITKLADLPPPCEKCIARNWWHLPNTPCLSDGPTVPNAGDDGPHVD